VPYIDFKIAKKVCTMEELLDRYNVKLRIIGGDTLRGKCPLPTHSSNNSGDSFSVSRSKNVWSCKSQSCINTSGRAGGNVLDFVATMEQCTLPEAAAKLVEWFGPAVDNCVTTSENGNRQKSPTEKAAPHMETRPDAPNGNTTGSHSNGNSSAGNGKGYMKEVDDWFDANIRRGDQEDEEGYYHRIRNAIKGKLIESFKNGKAAVQSAVQPSPTK